MITQIDIIELSEVYDATLLRLNLHQHLTPPSTPGLFSLEIGISVKDKLGYTGPQGFKVLSPYELQGFTKVSSIFDVSHDVILGSWYEAGATAYNPGVYRIVAKVRDKNVAVTPTTPDANVLYQGSVDYYVKGLILQRTAKAVVELRRLAYKGDFSVEKRCNELIEDMTICMSAIDSCSITARYEDLVSNLEALNQVIIVSTQYVRSKQ